MVNPKLFGFVLFVAGVLIATYYTIWAFSVLVSLAIYDLYAVAVHEKHIPRVYYVSTATRSVSFLVACIGFGWRNFTYRAIYYQD